MFPAQKKRPRNVDESSSPFALEDFSYIVVLAGCGTYLLLWTAYCVEKGHRRQKLWREYERYSA